MEHEDFGTRPTRDEIQAVRWKLGRMLRNTQRLILVIRLRIRTPILASVFLISKVARLELEPDDGLPTVDLRLHTGALIVAG
jgi:hypothetical protein